METKEKKLPPAIPASELKGFDTLALPSVSVLVSVRGFVYPMVGTYYYSDSVWSISGLCGNGWKVLEWWPLPVAGSGEPV